MALQTTLQWFLKLGQKPLIIDEQILDFLSEDNQENDESKQLSIPQILQEVYYVNQLSKSETNETNEVLSIQDKIYDYIRVFHDRIVELLNSHYKDLINETQSEEIIGQLKSFSGAKVGAYVQENLYEPFLSRDVAYMIFNLLPYDYKCHLPHYARREIVTRYQCFEMYWNKGMFLLCEMQKDIHTLDPNGLKQLLLALSNKNKNFRKRYLGEKKGCFSLTEVKKNGIQQDVLCFSGQKFHYVISEAIKCIEKSGHFRNPFIIKESDKVRYFKCPQRYVTYSDSCKTKKDYSVQMFSCCERKTFAEYDWQDVESYVMIVKYQPCELCQYPVHEHTMKYRGRIVAGIKLAPLRKIPLFNAIAEEIFSEIHESSKKE